MREFILAAILSIPLAAIQYTVPMHTGATAGSSAGATPSLVSFRGAPSTETSAVGAKANNTCAADSYCTQTPDNTLAGNGIIVFGTYADATAQTVTVYDCTTYGCTTTVDTFTSCGTQGGPENTAYAYCFYTLTATTGSRNITVKFSCTTACPSNVSAPVVQVMNVTAFDGYAKNTGTTTGTFASGSVTPTASGDLFFSYVVMAAGTMPTNVGAWALGSQANITWLPDLTDQRDATFLEHGVYSSTAALNPASSNATATDDYVALTVAFKAGSSGTAPSGMYITHLYTVNSAGSGSGNLVYQVPVAGNLIAGMDIGGSEHATGVSDSTNGTWISCGAANVDANNNVSSATFYYPSSAKGILPVTITTTGTGDIGPMIFADIAGAATTQECARASVQGNISATAATLVAMANYAPSSSAGIVLMGMAQEFNTSTGITTPTGSLWDMCTVGAENLDGPYPCDQNNGGAHIANSNNTPANVTWSLTDSTEAVGSEVTEIAGFQAPAATLYPVGVKRAGASTAVSGSTVVLSSYAPYKSGDLFAVSVCAGSASPDTGTISVSDPTNGTYTAVDGPTTMGGGQYCATFYKASVAATTVTITATFSTAQGTTPRSLLLEECANCSTLDAHNLVNVTSAANGSLTATAVTTSASHANEIAFGLWNCYGDCVLADNQIPSGLNLSPWTITNSDGGTAQGPSVSEFLAIGAASTSVAAEAWDNAGSGVGDVGATMTFY